MLSLPEVMVALQRALNLLHEKGEDSDKVKLTKLASESQDVDMMCCICSIPESLY
jgi:hypothetical protein